MRNIYALGNRSIRSFFALFLSLLLVVMTGCGDQATGVKLAETGITTADNMAAYYDSLIQDTIDIREMEAFIAQMRGVPLDEQQDKKLETQIEALSSRSRLARRLSATYRALKDLSSYNATGEVKTAAQGLSDAITGLVPLPGGINPSGIVGAIAEDITDWRQSRDIRKGGKLILKTLEQISTLFQKETPAYKSIAEERGIKVANIAEYLIQNEKVLAWPLIQKVPDALGLAWTDAKNPVNDDAAKKALIKLANVRLQRIAFLSSGAADNIDQSLTLLASNHKKFQEKQGVSLEEMLTALQRAQLYLDEINKLRKEIKPQTGG